jgi:hypothetical protein
VRFYGAKFGDRAGFEEIQNLLRASLTRAKSGRFARVDVRGEPFAARIMDHWGLPEPQ